MRVFYFADYINVCLIRIYTVGINNDFKKKIACFIIPEIFRIRHNNHLYIVRNSIQVEPESHLISASPGRVKCTRIDYYLFVPHNLCCRCCFRGGCVKVLQASTEILTDLVLNMSCNSIFAYRDSITSFGISFYHNGINTFDVSLGQVFILGRTTKIPFFYARDKPANDRIPSGEEQSKST